MRVRNRIYKVKFKEAPIEGKTEFYFGSLAAIYDAFSCKEIGCKVTRLWNIKITEENPYIGRKCTITKEIVARKKQTRRVGGNE
jgi:hypothetical protein